MGQNQVSKHEATDDTITTTTETVACTLNGVSTPGRRTVRIEGEAHVVTGAATTHLTPRIRRGTGITGTLIDEGNAVSIGAAAGGTELVRIAVEDDGVDLANADYVLTVQQTAATGNGTVLQASMSASWSD